MKEVAGSSLHGGEVSAEVDPWGHVARVCSLVALFDCAGGQP